MTTLYVASGNFLRCYVDTGGSSPPSTPAWSYNHGGTVYAVAVDAEGNIILGGAAVSGVSVRKLSSGGTLLWSQAHPYGILGVAVDSANNVIVAGVSAPGVAILKYDADGTQLWTKVHGNSIYYAMRAVAVDSSDNIYVGGDLYSGATLLKFSADGTALGTLNTTDPIYALTIGQDGYLYVCTNTGTAGETRKYSSGLALQWQEPHGRGLYAVATAAGIVQVAGNRDTNSGNMGMRRYSDAGALLWSTDTGNFSTCYGLSLDSGGASYVAGYFSTHKLRKYSNSGTLIWSYNTGAECRAVVAVVPLPVIFNAPPVPVPLSIAVPSTAVWQRVPALALPLRAGVPQWEGGVSTIQFYAPPVPVGLRVGAPLILHEVTGAWPVVYRAKLAGTPVLALSVRRISIRKGVAMEITVVCDASGSWPAVGGRIGALLSIERGLRLPSGAVVLGLLASGPLGTVASRLGANDSTVTLTALGPAPPIVRQTRVARGIAYRSGDAARRVRCDVDPFLSPDDALLLPGGDVLRVQTITLTITPDAAVMDVSE